MLNICSEAVRVEWALPHEMVPIWTTPIITQKLVVMVPSFRITAQRTNIILKGELSIASWLLPVQSSGSHDVPRRGAFVPAPRPIPNLSLECMAEKRRSTRLTDSHPTANGRSQHLATDITCAAISLFLLCCSHK